MPLLLYGKESWTLYQHEIRQYAIQKHHLHLNMNVKWDQLFRNEDNFVCAGVGDVELRLDGSCLYWFNHVCKLDDDRPLTDILFDELT